MIGVREYVQANASGYSQAQALEPIKLIERNLITRMHHYIKPKNVYCVAKTFDFRNYVSKGKYFSCVIVQF